MPITTGNTVVVPAGAVSLTVTGLFSLPYEIAPSVSWTTTLAVSGKTATQFVVTFTVPAPVGSTFDYIVVTPQVPEGVGAGLLAGTIITNVRDEIPDPVYDDAGNPLPDSDGMFRASTLYGWLDDGVRIMARLCGSIIDDWIALPQVGLQPWYAVPAPFQTMTDAFSNMWRISLRDINAGDVIWPSTPQAASQSLWGYQRKRTDHLEIGLWPVPLTSDPVTILVTALGVSGDPSVNLTGVTGFLPSGFVQIDSEIIQYQQVVGSSLMVLSRGQCGTTAVTHLAGAAVLSLGLWIRGTRSPMRIIASTSFVELPLDIVGELKTYLLARCRRAENEHEEARALMKEFQEACRGIRGDPNRIENTWQVPAFGESSPGPIYPGGGFGIIVR